jgi:hypothetical protein
VRGGSRIGVEPGKRGVQDRVLGLLERGVGEVDGSFRVVLRALCAMLGAPDVALGPAVIDVLADRRDVLIPVVLDVAPPRRVVLASLASLFSSAARCCEDCRACSTWVQSSAWPLSLARAMFSSDCLARSASL